MKTIGLLGGTGWSSTIKYYTLLNELVNKRLGGYHSAKILLKSIDYHDIMSCYGKDHEKTAEILQQELSDFLVLKPDCLIICCNSLHKYYDMIQKNLKVSLPVFHAIYLVAEYLVAKDFNQVLLLATRFTMEDGFFANILQQKGIAVTIPTQEERSEMQRIHDELMLNIITEESRDFFSNLIARHRNLDAVVLGCTEYPLVVNHTNAAIPIVDPMYLQAIHAVDYVLR